MEKESGWSAEQLPGFVCKVNGKELVGEGGVTRAGQATATLAITLCWQEDLSGRHSDIPCSQT